MAGNDMPTILRESGFAFYFYSEEGGEPPHVHADKGGGTVKFWLLTLRVAGSEGLKPAELKLALELAEKNRDVLLEKWYDFFERKS